MSFLYFIIPGLSIALSTWLAIKAVKRGANKKKAVALQICSTAFVALMCFIMPAVSAHAESTEAASAVSSATAAANASAYGVGLIAAALVTGLSGIGGGIAVASAAPAAIAATSENPQVFGKALILVALGEGIAIFGLVVSIMMFGKLDSLVLGA